MKTGTAAIIGGGVIGGGWAARFLLMGWDVRVFDPDPEAERKIAEVLQNARRSLPGLYETALPAEGRLAFCETLEDAVAGADWVQENVPERIDLKRDVIARIQAHEAGAVPIASSTSGFKPSELCRGAAHPEAILVAHPFNPVYLLPVVEIVGHDRTAPGFLQTADEILTAIGMRPVRIRAEIDAHVADRLLEAVWREALWLVRDGVATTQEIDDIIRFGFGLRWAQMGLFETYRIAGGEAGMRHFIEQFGPALKWPWTRLMDVPDLDDRLIELVASQSDAQSGDLTIRQLERLRDDNLVAILRALKGRGAAAGQLIAAHEATGAPDRRAPFTAEPIVTVRRTVPIDWTDYNGHMNEGRYGQVWSDAADDVMIRLGADADYIAAGLSYFTVDTHTRFLDEAIAGQAFHVTTQCLLGAGKKLRLYHEMVADDGRVLATCEQFLLHVSLTTRKTCDPEGYVLERTRELAAAHADLPWPHHLEGA